MLRIRIVTLGVTLVYVSTEVDVLTVIYLARTSIRSKKGARAI